MNLLMHDVPNWCVLFTMPNQERIVSRGLQKNGIEAFLPLRKEMRQWSDRRRSVEVPLFPNYLFVKVPMTQRHKVFVVPGIVRFLGCNGKVSIIPEKQIEIIKNLVEGKFEVTQDTFLEGDEVMITSGPLRNVAGILINRKGNKRLLIEIGGLNKNLLIDVASYQLEKRATLTK